MSTPTIPPNRRILVVDDNPAIHEDFRKILAPRGDASTALDAAEEALFGAPGKKAPTRTAYELEFASQGQEGFEKVRAARAAGRPFALAFMDVRMPPGWNGVETTGRIWADADAELQVVICTAYSDYSWDEMVAHIGQSDRLVILKKPFDNVEVLQLASALTEKWRLQQEARSRLDQLEGLVNLRTADLKRSIKILQENVQNQQRAEERLRKSEERFRLIAENAADLILVISAEGDPEYLSPSIDLALGYRPGELKDTCIFDLFHPEDRESTIQTIESSETQGGCRLLEFRLQHKDGYWRHAEARVCSIREKGDNEPHFVIVARDVTDHKRMEKETDRLTQELVDVQMSDPFKPRAASLVSRLESPLKRLTDQIRFVQDAFHQLSPLLEDLRRFLDATTEEKLTPELLAQALASKHGTDTAYLTAQLPKALLESLESAGLISEMLADLKKSATGPDA